IEEDFFRSPLTEEERKIAIHPFPRTSSMNYNPSPLNDSASSAVKKADTALYGIQVALAQATRPIDYFVHLRIQENPGLDTSEDPEVMFASTMRALLSEMAAKVTQARLDNLHKELKLPGKPTQLVEPDSKPLMGQEALNDLISKKTAAKCQHVQPFRKRQQSSKNKNSISSNSITAQSTNAATTAEATSNHKTSDRQLLLPAVHDPQKEWRPQTSLGPPQTESKCGGAELQDGGPIIHLPHGPQKRLFDLSRPPGCFMYILVFKQCQKYLRIHWNGCCFQFRVLPFGLSLSPLAFAKVLRPVLQWTSPSNVDCSPTWPSNAPTTSGTQELLSVDIEIMDFDSETDEPSIQNLLFWKNQLKSWNGLSFLPETPELDIFTDSSDYAWGIVVGHHTYSGSWTQSEAKMHINAKELMTVFANRAEGAQGTNNDDFSYANVEIGYMVPGSDVPLCVPTFTTASNNTENSAELSSHPMLAEFTKTLDDASIVSFVRPVLDIAPVLDTFKEWGPTSDLTVKRLTAKLCWLLSVTGFLRPSDIHRIDDERSHVARGMLHLVIVTPNEKRAGRPIKKPCQISSHTDPILCSVLEYSVYKEKVANTLFPTSNTNNSKWVVNRLLRFVNYKEKPLSVDRISRYIRSISDLIRRGPDTPIPKGRAIGETLAANSGVSADEIVSHAFWSNYTIFDTYYRLTRNSSNNLTESIL
ncbi:hypothetical protein AYI69_g11127, partial [Smittium culicis]